MNTLVVPTIREPNILEFLFEWSDKGFDKIIVVEDNPERTFKIPDDKVDHYSWKEIEKEWGDDAWIFSRRDSAIRCFGFWKAWTLDSKIIFSLDDDCYPLPGEDFLQGHLNNLCLMPQWTESIPGLRTRGLPYFNKGEIETVVNMGLWTNVADLDAIQQLANPIPDFYPMVENRIIPRYQYFPFCGMNFAFRRRVTSLTYFPLMGEGSPYRRFDDIWFGIILKKICDHLDWNVSVGHPFIEHKKASDPMVNLVKEAPGIKRNETFWEVVNNIRLTQTHPTECMFEVSEAFKAEDDDYIKKLGKAIEVWARRF